MKKRLAIASILSVLALLAVFVTADSSSNAPSTCSGDWSNCSNANANGGGAATAARDDTGSWEDNGFSIPSTATVDSVTVNADFWASRSNGYLEVRVSNDGGSNWGSVHQVGGNTAEQTFNIDVSSDFSWVPSDLDDGNLVVEATCVRVGGGKPPTCSLDYIPVTVEYTVDSQPVATADATPTSGLEDLEVDFTCSAVGGDAPLDYFWTFGDGANSSSQNPTHTYTSGGNFTATCTVTDVDLDQDSDAVVISVETDLTPIATADATPTSGLEPLDVDFTGTGTGGNGPLTYFWDFDDGTNSSSQNPSHQYTSFGTYTAVLTVTDDDGDFDTDNVVITVNEDLQPTATADATPTSGLEPLEVTFDGTGTGGNAPLSYIWDFGDGSPNSTSEDPTHTYTSAGTYFATLYVTDDDGDIDSDSVQIDVEEDLTPSIIFTFAAPTNGTAPLNVAFNGAGSGGNGVLTYLWQFGDGANASMASVNHTYTSVGNYTATLFVFDEDGDSDSGNQFIFVD